MQINRADYEGSDFCPKLTSVLDDTFLAELDFTGYVLEYEVRGLVASMYRRECFIVERKLGGI